MIGDQRHPRPLALVLGVNEIASAVAVYLHRAGYACLLAQDSFPPVIRRRMAYHDVLFGDPVTLGGIEGVRTETAFEVLTALERPGCVAVTPLPVSELIALRTPRALIDARMQKYCVTPDWRHIARLTIGLGPNFAVGVNCDVAIETRPDHVGIVRDGATAAPDHAPRALGGVGAQRFVYAECDAVWHTALDIGARVYRGLAIGRLGAQTVVSPLDGVLRGVVRDGMTAAAGAKLLEIDPRHRDAVWAGLDERGVAIARTVVEAARVKSADQDGALHAAPLALQ